MNRPETPAEVEGVVEEIWSRPGHEVEQGVRIVRLANPRLRRAVVQAELALAEIEADHRSLLASVVERRLAAEAGLLNAQAAYSAERLRLRAQTELRDRNAVSEIDFADQQIRTERAKAAADFEARRVDELGRALDAEVDAGKARVEARSGALAAADAELAALTVRASIPGTLRELFVEPGSRVAAGDQIARVVDTSSLMAVVRVPESYAGHLAPGQPARATVLGIASDGVVARVDPAVKDGTVAIDVELTPPLPRGARPDLSVRATVTVAELDDVLFIRRPMFVRDHQTADVFVLEPDHRRATRTPVRFGMGTLKDIHVVGGVGEGDEILLGSPRHLEGLDTVALR